MALSELAIHGLRRLKAVTSRQLLKKLPTRLWTFIQDGDAATIFSRGSSRRQAGWAGTNDQYFHRLLGNSGHGLYREHRRPRWQRVATMGLVAHVHACRQLG